LAASPVFGFAYPYGCGIARRSIAHEAKALQRPSYDDILQIVARDKTRLKPSGFPSTRHKGSFEMKKFTCIALVGFVVSTSGALAAPQSLYGKTLRVTWNESRSQRVRGEGEFKSVSIPLSYTVYVSSKGQIFKRLTSTNASGNHTGSKDRVGMSGSDDQGAGSISFSGNTLISTANNGGLGRRIRIGFDGGSLCSAEVLTGKAGIGAATVRSNATGKMLEFESVSAGAASCSVQEGNAFAN
jgi:hypothetical protein